MKKNFPSNDKAIKEVRISIYPESQKIVVTDTKKLKKEVAGLRSKMKEVCDEFPTLNSKI